MGFVLETHKEGEGGRGGPTAYEVFMIVTSAVHISLPSRRQPPPSIPPCIRPSGHIRVAFANLQSEACAEAAARLKAGFQELVLYGIRDAE